jgi:protein-tyrosine phosphatase
MEKKKVLFVCTGNICRSPGAEAIFKQMAVNKGLDKEFEIDSAGTTAYHVGEPADKRMRAHAKKRGYNLTGISRKFNPNQRFRTF